MPKHPLVLLVPLLAGLLTSCATPQPAAVSPPPPAPAPAAPAPPALPSNIFLLLPDAPDKVGAIEVANAGGSVVLTEAGLATRVASASDPPTAPTKMSEQEINAIFGPVLAALPTPPARFILYFERDTQLTAEARQLLPQILAAIRDRHSVDVSVVGHADTAGSREYNYQLSRRRAEAVAQLLVAGGAATEILDVTSHGKDNPAVPTGDNVSEPRTRRVEVTVR